MLDAGFGLRVAGFGRLLRWRMLPLPRPLSMGEGRLPGDIIEAEKDPSCQINTTGLLPLSRGEGVGGRGSWGKPVAGARERQQATDNPITAKRYRR